MGYDYENIYSSGKKNSARWGRQIIHYGPIIFDSYKMASHVIKWEEGKWKKNTITHSSNTSKLDIAFQIYLGKWAIEVKKETLVMESIWSWNEGTTRSS